MTDKKEYIIRCPECNGARSFFKADGKRAFCPTCRGAGEVTYSKDYLMYKVMDLNRKININWDALEHRRAIPRRFFVNIPLDCPRCQGKKKVDGVKCTSCSGSGYSYFSTRKVFRLLFKSFSSLKTQRDNFNTMIEEKVWLEGHAATLIRIKPFKPNVVCTRCTHYLNENVNNPCNKCSNHLLSDKVFCFKAVTPSAERWYKKEGHKWNYRPKRDRL